MFGRWKVRKKKRVKDPDQYYCELNTFGNGIDVLEILEAKEDFERIHPDWNVRTWKVEIESDCNVFYIDLQPILVATIGKKKKKAVKLPATKKVCKKKK
jgi:hypothetical protein